MIEAKFFTVGTYLYKYNLTVLFVSPSKIAHDKFYIYCPPLLLNEIYARASLILSLLGYGVISSKDIEAGEFLLEFAGRHMTGSEGEALFKEYSAEDAVFLYFYTFQGHVCW